MLNPINKIKLIKGVTMKLSTMVEENISFEEKCKKKKLMEEAMKYCAKCGTEYDESLEACPSCEATETFSKCESIELRIAKKESQLNAGGAEDEATLATEIESLKARKESECSEEEAEGGKEEMPMELKKKEVMVESVVLVETPLKDEDAEEIAYLKSLSGL